METALAKTERVEITEYTSEQKDLIKKTCFPDSTDDELKMYLHVAKTSGLDPLRRQLHASKRGGRVVFIADINGLQARAAREADYQGIDHATVNEGDDFLFDHKEQKVVKHISNPFSGKRPVGAWAIVYREGMRPFVSVVRFDEYIVQSNPMWKSMPSVMIDKCAKSTALRLAYPEQLGNIYERAELDRASPDEAMSQEEPSPQLDAVKAATKRLIAAGKGRAKDKPQPMRIVDVQPEETEEQATAREGAKLTMGSKAGVLVADIAWDDLHAIREKATEYLRTVQDEEIAKAVRVELEKVETEMARRQKDDIG